MGWRRGASEQFHVLGRIAASAGDGEGLSPEQLAPLIDSVIDRHLGLGTLRDENEAAAFRRYMAADLTGGADALAERERQLEAAMAQRADRNGSMRAAGRPSDGEQLLGRAVEQRKFAPSRLSYWRERFRRDPAATRSLIDSLEAPPEFIAANGTTGSSDESLVGAVSPAAALRLGMAVRTEHPLGGDLPGRVRMPPPQGPIHKISDRA
jgi:hypothetical protein